jgi:superfamily II DNA or RNA helicase
VSYTPGSLVSARGRDWVVQPGSDDDFLLLMPLGGRDEEQTGLLVALEPVIPATFGAPNPEHVGDALSAGLLRDASRLSFRAATGPFRSFARIAVEPRPYQLVPLLMALKLEPVRLLIADDVGVGKTVEACLIARELLDRGEVNRFTVLCPPHLADQWRQELHEKFHIDATLVLPSTAARLDRNLGHGQSIFERYPFTIVSTDFIKSDRRRDDFLHSAPELIIVDEAHTAADPGDARGGRHQRNQLLRGLSKRQERHLILVTATPHSGKEEAFRSLLSLLKPEFARLPEDLSGPRNEGIRRELSQHFVQRKRGDILRYLNAETDFPERDDADVPYQLSAAAKALFSKVLNYAREELKQDDGSHRQRVRWWATLGLLRALASSPAAAAATLRNRAAPADTETIAEADEVGRRAVFDQLEDDSPEGVDVTPGGQVEGETAGSASRRRLLAFAQEAEALKGADDRKLAVLTRELRTLLSAGYAPIVFCRFIETAQYVAEALRQSLRNVQVDAVTGTLPPDERELRVTELMDYPERVLVATDCLSEGVNLQRGFNAVIHYDLSWNPTRHEQREGRVDRYGQSAEKVVVRTMYGTDNQIDGIVLDVLIKKHKMIRSSLGISVPVPADSDEVVEAIFEGLLLRGHDARPTQQGVLFEDLNDYIAPRAKGFSEQWEAAAQREKRSHTMFAQETIKVEEVARELEQAQTATGGAGTVRRFVINTVRLHQGVVTAIRGEGVKLGLERLPAAITDQVQTEALLARFELPVAPDETYLARTHPFTETLASYVLDSALDEHNYESRATRAAAMRTRSVERRTTLLLARFRYHLTTTAGRGDSTRSWQTLAEEIIPLAFEGGIDNLEWLTLEAAEQLIEAEPDGNLPPPQARQFVARALEANEAYQARVEQLARDRARVLLEAHERVRSAARAKGLRYEVSPLLPADLLGVYVYLPAQQERGVA